MFFDSALFKANTFLKRTPSVALHAVLQLFSVTFYKVDTSPKRTLRFGFWTLRFCQGDPTLKSITASLNNGIKGGLICRELTVVIIRFVVLYLSVFFHVTC